MLSLVALSHNACFGYQPQAGQTDKANASDEVKSDASSLNHSAVPLRDREFQERLTRIESMIDRREFAAALAEIRQAVDHDSDQLVQTDESLGVWQQYQDRHAVVQRLLLAMPADIQTQWLMQTEPLVRNQFLSAVRDTDLEALRGLARQFPLTDASRDAARFLMSWHLDRREFAAAHAVARRLLDEPRLAEEHRAAVVQIIDLCLKLATQNHVLPANRPTASNSNPLRHHRPSGPNTNRDRDEPSLRSQLFPALDQPKWQVSSGLNEETAMLARHALHEHFEQSIPILPRARPLILEGIVLRRSLNHLSAHALETGELLWSDESESDAGQSAARLTMNLSLQELMAQKLARGLQIDSLQSRLTTDGERIFTVEPGGEAMTRRSSVGSTLLIGSGYQNQAGNRIVARNLRTGTVAWYLTADSVLRSISNVMHADGSAQPNNPGGNSEDDDATRRTRWNGNNYYHSADVYFCGLPATVDRHIIGLVQVDDSLWAYAADRRTGQIDWSHHVADAARQSPADSDWRSLDCRIALVDGVLVCSTGAGLLVGVDLATQSPLWSRRYSRADMPLPINRLPVVTGRTQRPWWQGWRDVTLLPVVDAVDSATNRSGSESPGTINDSIVVVAGPDADGVQAINPRTGQLLWQQSFESPVEILSEGDRIVVVSRHGISAFAVDSGAEVWRVTCQEPVGTGYTTRVATKSSEEAAYHIVPVRGGSLIAVNLDDGTLVKCVDKQESLSGCLVSAGGHVVSLNSDRMMVWPILASQRDQQATVKNSQQSHSSDSEIAAVTDTAALDRASGLFEKAAERLRTLPESPSVKRELQKTLLAWLEGFPQTTENVTAIATELEQLAGEQSIADLIAIRHTAARAAVQTGSPLEALNYYVKLQSLNPTGEPRFLKPEPLRSVRHDRLIQGELIDLIESGDDQVASAIRAAFSELAVAAESSQDPFALQRFTRQWQGLPLAAWQVLDERSRIGLRYGQKQLALLALTESDIEDIAAEASRNLIELYESRSYSRDAAAIRRTATETNDSDTLADSGASPWNSGPVKVSEHPEQNLDTTFIPVPVTCQPGTLFDRLNVTINPRSSRDETVLRFYGDGISGYWQTVLATSASPLKSVGRLYRGWGIGHFLVLQLGGELFGISPFDSSGEPRIQRVWSIDMANGNRQEDHRYAVAIPGFTEEKLTMLDAFGRPITTVGPVRAGYLCFQTRGKLVCLDTATGQRLWQRYELPRNAICSGDGQRVFMIQPERDLVTVLRVVDGATESEFALSTAAGFEGLMLNASDGRILTGQRASDSNEHPDVLRLSKVASVNLQRAAAEWTLNVAPESAVFALGARWIGMLQTTGDLQIVDLLSGQEVSRLHVQRPDRIRAVHVASDASSHLVTLSKTAESAFLNGRAAGNDVRNPPVTGHLLAIDSLTGNLLWQRPVDQIQFLLDQPKNAPCVVLNYRRSRTSGTESTESVLHLMNRMSGEDILNRRGSSAASAFTFEPHADQHRFSIRMARKSIRLTFVPGQSP